MYELFQFIWHVAEDGHEWQSGPMRPITVDVRKHGEPALIALGERSRPYKPEPNLFLKFASVDPDADLEILRFANSYGLLGGGPRTIAPEPKRKETPTAGVTGELQSHWQQHLHRMKAAVTLWEAIKADDSSFSPAVSIGEATLTSLTTGRLPANSLPPGAPTLR